MPWTFIWAAVLVTVVLVVVWTWRNPVLARKLYANSRTLLAARLVQVVGVLLALHDFAWPIIAQSDLRPIIPDQWEWVWPIAILAIGQIFDRLRKLTDKPLEVREAYGRQPLSQLLPGRNKR